jgi:hypothetical protein
VHAVHQCFVDGYVCGSRIRIFCHVRVEYVVIKIHVSNVYTCLFVGR